LLFIGLGLVFLGFFGTGDTFFFGLASAAFLDTLGVFLEVFFASVSLSDFSKTLDGESVFLVVLESFLDSELLLGVVFTFFFQRIFYLECL
jgi:hypothetical protein